MDEEAAQVRRRRPVKRLVALAVLVLALVALLVLWTQRLPIASDYIRGELEHRDVQASYEVRRIGLRTQRIENLVIGDPRRPDLTARWVEVDLAWAWGGPRVTMIRARGVRLYGRLVDGRLTLGQVDRLLPPPSGLPFRFPDQNVDVADAAIRLDTPAGRVGVAVEGRGNLADGFRGRMAARAPALDFGGCTLSGVGGATSVAIDDLRPTARGPVSASALDCGRYAQIAKPRLDVALTLAQALDAWEGRAAAAAEAARFGPNRMAGLLGNIGFAGDAERTQGRLELSSAAARLYDFTSARARVDGRYVLGLDEGRFSLVGDVSATGLSGGRDSVAPAARSLASLGGTPLEPIGDSLARALRRALSGFDAAASLRLVAGPGIGGVRIDSGRLLSRSGARAGFSAGDGVTYVWRDGTLRVDGDFALAGGSFPAARVSLVQAAAGAPMRGIARIEPIRAGGARLALGEIRFDGAAGGATRISTVAAIDGPIEDGRVEGLVLPVSGRLDGGGGFAFGEGCVETRFRSLRIGGLRLGATRVPLCPTGRALVWRNAVGAVQGGAAIRAARLAGTLGQTPIRLSSNTLRFGLSPVAFSGTDVSVLLGNEGSQSRLDVATLAGRLTGPGVGGTYSGLSGKLAGVPLLLSEGAGDWRVRDGDVRLAGRMRVADEMDPSRFHPLQSDDFRLTLADNLIQAGGWLHDPETGTPIARADVEHHLRTGRGRALLEVPGIDFDPAGYQPEQLTRLTTGVVALVDGTLRGRGEIRWNETGTASTGVFSTQSMNLAATFGPVEGLTTTLNFTDLLGLVTAPGQLAEVGRIRTGIDVLDGRIRYQVLPNLHVRVESGIWPFAGGELRLEETVLDFSRPSPKRLTFRVAGLDAARFIEIMEFSNIRATGTFDGIIPMVFDEGGGRIESGSLIARAEGGTLSYKGELTDKDLGAYGKLAFDALKSLRYSRLDIGLHGSLDGEFVAGIELDGVARDPTMTVAPSGGIKGMIAGRALSQLARIPFEFNIDIRGPFRALLATARSFEDPTDLIQGALPAVMRKRDPLAPVQPQESEDVP